MRLCVEVEEIQPLLVHKKRLLIYIEKEIHTKRKAQVHRVARARKIYLKYKTRNMR